MHIVRSTAVLLGLFSATLVHATAQRTFVASNGNDANPCSITAPCRGFAAALVQTTSGGEIIVLDSAGYGPVTINQAVSIIAPPGVYAGVSVLSGTGLAVNSGSGAVVLSGLTIVGLGGVTGIDFQSGSSLRVERTSISGIAGRALQASLSAAATLIIHDSAFVANDDGIRVATSAGVLNVEIDSSRFDRNIVTGADFENNVAGVVSGSSFSGNGFGAAAQAQTSGATNKMTFRNCVFSANGNIGLLTGGSGGTTTITQVTDSEVSDNSIAGIQIQTASTVLVSNTTIARNGVGIVNVGGGISRTFQDNRLYGNTTDGTFSSTIGKQ